MNNEERIEKAVALFKEGYNCSQSVVAAFADQYGFTREQALRMSASFGGGIGRMRMVCGAASGMFLLAGLHNGSAKEHDNEGKMANYTFVQHLASEFKNKYGTLICAELLGLAPRNAAPTTPLPAEATHPQPAERTQQYYEKRPCVEMVAEAVRIYLKNTPTSNI